MTLIEANPYISVSAMAEECGMSVKAIRSLIDELRKDKLIERVGPNRGGYWKLSYPHKN